MNYESMFSGVGLLSMLGWLPLMIYPLIPVWADRMAGLAIPALLASIYILIVVFFPAESGGFGSFKEVSDLFMNPQAVMAGWIHFLAFDLLIGAWICKTARAEGVRFRFVAPCLPFTFLFGPAGFMLFTLVRAYHRIW